MVKAFIDRISSLEVEGWAVPELGDACKINVLIGDRVVASGEPDRPRPDVWAAVGQAGNSRPAGFRIDFPRPLDDTRARCAVSVKIAEIDRVGRVIDSLDLSDSLFGGGDGVLVSAPWLDRAPFPKSVADILATFWHDDFASGGFDDEDVQNAAVDRIVHLALHSNPGRFAGLTAYLRFLRACWSHGNFVERWFPRFNARSKPGEKDWVIQATHKREMISIANHLYCLKSHGLDGDLAEFGCFKGFSSCMLSHACSLLGIRMHVFDSFAGLPQSASTYYAAGEFAGSLQEVRQNLELYGVPNSVRFHPGYFSDTVVDGSLPPLLCIWMDVDLESSAEDVMRALPRLARGGAVFSHECKPSNFTADGVVSPRTPDDVIPPILDAFQSRGTQVAGRFIFGYTGAFWGRAADVPVLSNDVLMRLVDLA